MIKIENLNIRLLDFNLHDIKLEIGENEFFILMGPTGAGKTVLLEAIAGLVPIKSGRIIIEKKDITKLAPERRGISIVYQDYALFPHLTVKDNITYGLHFHRNDKTKAKKDLTRLVEELNLSHLLRRFPTNLSGGEKQRVALARALMVEPKVLLLDEPISALDPRFREEVRRGLKRAHQSSNITFFMVTHDFAEALSLADRAAVINDGKIEQAGKMEDIFQKPRSTFVADFVGMKNLFAAQYKGTKAIVDDVEIELGRELSNTHGYIAIRPEDIVISRKSLTSSMRNSFRGKVTGVIDQGFSYEVHVQVGQISFKSLITKRSLVELDIHEGSEVMLSFKSAAIHNF
jgi:molybdate/tungstate transport system ATP-binding protein